MFQAVPGGFSTAVIAFAGASTGLLPGDHGFHVHEFGDLSNRRLGAGLQYNLFISPHGGQDDPPPSTHVGDLGNIMTPVSPSLYFASGPTTFVIHDSFVTFTGNRGIVERAIVVHEKKDDLGRGRDAESRRTGNAGARIACG
ncbi:unnamed protein product, partial [Angiostrongylus costaricensis]|uniref:Superoxide dismutase n=1 Tax=Angiostrongylus costaricensis TaxID=334426 RepID=A0A0R3PEV0_ANGCS